MLQMAETILADQDIAFVMTEDDIIMFRLHIGSVILNVEGIY